MKLTLTLSSKEYHEILKSIEGMADVFDATVGGRVWETMNDDSSSIAFTVGEFFISKVCLDFTIALVTREDGTSLISDMVAKLSDLNPLIKSMISKFININEIFEKAFKGKNARYIIDGKTYSREEFHDWKHENDTVDDDEQ